MANNNSWKKIFDEYQINKHDFSVSPFHISALQIKRACQEFKETGEKEVRILCKQDSREDRPTVFIENNLFILPTKNKYYSIIQGEGYFDLPQIEKNVSEYKSKLPFELETSKVGNSEMQHLDFAYATSLIRSFMNDSSLVLTIRGRKFTPDFKFYVGKHEISVSSVQTEVDAGYEGEQQIVLVEAKNFNTTNVIIRQLYYPYRQWQKITQKKVITLFFEKNTKLNCYSIWQFEFTDIENYNSINFVRSGNFRII